MKYNIPEIYDYDDYRKYLMDMFEAIKKHKVSKRKFAKETGISNAYITMVLNGKRNLDPKYIESFAHFLKLTGSEISYFENLVIFSDSDDSKVRNEAFKKLRRFKSFQDKKTSDVVTHRYLEHWYYVAIRELSFTEGFVEDPVWIQKKLRGKLTQAQVKAALKFLNKHDLLAGGDDSHFNCSEGIYKLALGKFHREMLGLVADSIDKVDRSERQILGFTKTLSKKNFDQAAKIMNEAIEKINQLEGNESENDLYHFYMTGIPLTYRGEDHE